ncbi:MAG: hypothetical protein K6G17_06460 [Oscillospiraceae bacterium]|nr:hypothetical protein [Oscillospiraceae bacterium]
MSLKSRLRRLEHARSPVLSMEEQERRLEAFVECETMVTGQRPSDTEVGAEKQRLAQPIRKPKPKEIRVIAEEIKRIMNDRP